MNNSGIYLIGSVKDAGVSRPAGATRPAAGRSFAPRAAAMSSSQRRKITPKRQATRRALRAREPKLVENTKSAFFLRGSKCSQVVSHALRDLYVLKKPNAKNMSKRNPITPFEDHSSLEFLSQRMDASLFCFGSSSKKKGQSLTFGRMFDYQLLDMVEVSIQSGEGFKRIESLAGARKQSAKLGSKPMFVFRGDAFESSEDHKLLKSLVLDFFRGDVVPKINLAGLDRVVVCTAGSDSVYFRHYAVRFKRSGTKIPDVVLEEIGPRMNWTIRRSKSAGDEVRKEAMRVPKKRKSQKKVKNIERGTLGNKMGRVHMKSQDTQTMALRKFKALKKRRGGSSGGSSGGAAGGDERAEGPSRKRQK